MLTNMKKKKKKSECGWLTKKTTTTKSECGSTVFAFAFVFVLWQPENIMLLDQSSTKIKLIDFGLARRLTDKEDMRAMMGTAEFIGNIHQVH